MNQPLYALTGRYAELLELAEQGEDVGDALAQIDDAIEAKALGIVHVLAQLEADETVAANEAERLALRARRFGTTAARLRDYIKGCMQASNIRSVKSPVFSITLSNGQPRVVITDASKVPAELMRQPKTPEPEPDKPAILKLHKETGETIPGVDIVPTTKLLVR
jgi:hypothetical protein